MESLQIFKFFAIIRAMIKKVINSIIHSFLLGILISCSHKPISHEATKLENIEINSNMQSDSSIEALIKPYREPLITSMSEILIYSNNEAVKGLPESSLGNLIADLLLEGSKRKIKESIDLAFLNTGGLRVEWPKGAITRSMVYELMPFENLVEVVSIRGSELKILLDQIAARGGTPVAGLKFGIHKSKAVDIYIANKPLVDENTYRMVSTDYLLNNGDKYQIPITSNRKGLEIKFRDLLLDELVYLNAQSHTLSPAKDGRIHLINTP
jgi:2',3'-cyclic-nucleotide 2'-phosphodiesterase (5'-nucleotidase family)